VSVSCESCVLSLRRADRSSGGVLPSVVCLSVMSNPRYGGGLGPLGMSSHGKEEKKAIAVADSVVVAVRAWSLLSWSLSRGLKSRLGMDIILANNHFAHHN
jgi:hypothetical protein